MQIIVATTTAFLVAGRFGLAPTVKRGATAGLKLVEDPDAAGLKTGDPAGNFHLQNTRICAKMQFPEGEMRQVLSLCC